MKLLQINTSLNTSSTGKIVSQISKMVQEDGGESYIAYSGKYPVNTNEVNSFRVGSKLDFYWHALITRFFDLFILRVESISDDPTGLSNPRFNMWVAGLNGFMDSPLIGNGIGSFGEYYTGLDSRGYPHNLFIEIMSNSKGTE